MAVSDWSGAGYVQVTSGTGFGAGTKGIEGVSAGGRGGFVAATKTFGQGLTEGQIVELTAEMYWREGAVMGRIGFFDGTVAGGGNGDPQGVGVDLAGNNWWLSQTDAASTSFGPETNPTGVYKISLVLDGASDSYWAKVTAPDLTEYVSPTLLLAGKFESDMVGLQYYVKNFGGLVPDFDNMAVNVTAVPEPATVSGWAAILLLGWSGIRRAVRRSAGS